MSSGSGEGPIGALLRRTIGRGETVAEGPRHVNPDHEPLPAGPAALRRPDDGHRLGRALGGLRRGRLARGPAVRWGLRRSRRGEDRAVVVRGTAAPSGGRPTPGRPYHPQTQGKIERLNSTLEAEPVAPQPEPPAATKGPMRNGNSRTAFSYAYRDVGTIRHGPCDHSRKIPKSKQYLDIFAKRYRMKQNLRSPWSAGVRTERTPRSSSKESTSHGQQRRTPSRQSCQRP